MKVTRGNQVRAAKLLGITRATLRKRIEIFGIAKESHAPKIKVRALYGGGMPLPARSLIMEPAFRRLFGVDSICRGVDFDASLGEDINGDFHYGSVPPAADDAADGADIGVVPPPSNGDMLHGGE